MTRCRLHVFPPEDDDVPTGSDEESTDPSDESTASDEVEKRQEQLKSAFDERFTESETAAVQDHSREWVSEVFEDTPENVERIDEMEAECHRLYPEADVFRIRQERDVMDGQAEEFGYETAIMLRVTHAIV